MKRGTAPTKLYRQIVETHDCTPSLNCLATWAGLPYTTAWRALNRLEEHGWVKILNRGRNRIDGSQLVVLPAEL